jgi:nucleoside-diphosphate-sugar epimerase
MVDSVAVTGATGFIGRRLVESLLASGFEVRALCRDPENAALPAGVSVIRGALESDASLNLLVAEADAVVHCAGLIKAATRADLDRVNRCGTALLLESCARQPAPPRVVFVSSLAARHPELSHYAISKRRAEEELARREGRLHWTAIRPPAVYGPGDRETFQLFRALRYGLFPTPALERARLSLIYVDDLCEAIVALLSVPIESGSLFEIRDACAEGYSWRAIAEASANHLGRKVVRVPMPLGVMRVLAAANHSLSRITGHVPRFSPGKVRELFHENWVCHDNPLARHTQWRPKVDLAEGIGRTLSWYQKHGWL